MIFVGYDGYSKNFRLWDPERRKIETSCNVIFNEKDEIKKSENLVKIPIVFSNYNQDDEEEQPEREGPGVTPVNEERQLRDRSVLKPPDYYGQGSAYCAIIEPQTYGAAIKSAESKNWQAAMEDEMTALKSNNTWCLVPLPVNAKTLDNKWVYRIKSGIDGKIIRFKARLVARGFTQEKDIDYTETFAPVVRYDSIRLLLAIAAENNFHIAQFDVKTAFLYGELKLGFKDEKFPDRVCKLNKSLYGLKQSPRCWNKRFVDCLNHFKFKQLISDACVFVGKFKNNVIYLALCVDDGLIISSSQEANDDLIMNLKNNFKIVIGDATQFVLLIV